MLVLPPFAEELNKSRSLITLTATQLATAGCDVLVVDLSGTGDSEGHFGHCQWHHWLDDIQHALKWLADTANTATSAVLTIRAGSLFLPDLFQREALQNHRILMWQPIYEGSQYLRQLLRLRVMSNRFAGINESINDLLNEIKHGNAVEVAGYDINATLGQAIYAAEIKTLDLSSSERVDVFEIRPNNPAKISAAGQEFLDHLHSINTPASAVTVVGEQFWATQEISVPAAVVECTVRTLAAK